MHNITRDFWLKYVHALTYNDIDKRICYNSSCPVRTYVTLLIPWKLTGIRTYVTVTLLPWKLTGIRTYVTVTHTLETDWY